MGDEIKVLDVQVIQGGVLQIDFVRTEDGKTFRSFCDGNIFFEKLGRSMAMNHVKWQGEYARQISEGRF